MKKETKIQLFQKQNVRTHWDDKKEKWYFSIVDVIAILTESKNPRRYWSDLKIKLAEEGSELYDKIVQLKMKSSDGKFYKTDVADTEQLLRLIQSIPSPKAEPFKVWLAKVGYERIEETEDPELAFDRAMATYLKKGYSLNQFRKNETYVIHGLINKIHPVEASNNNQFHRNATCVELDLIKIKSSVGTTLNI
jgi:hypothetical protein